MKGNGESIGSPERTISVTLPLGYINNKMYQKLIDDKETEPVYQEELGGKVTIAGKNITLLKFRPKLQLTEIKIIDKRSETKEVTTPRLSVKGWFSLSPKDDEDKNKDKDDPYYREIKEPKGEDFKADLDIFIDQKTGKIQIKPKYAVLEAQIKIGTLEPFCHLSIPLRLESLKMELPLGVSTSTIAFPAPIKKTFIMNSDSEFIQGTINDSKIEFKYEIDIEEQVSRRA